MIVVSLAGSMVGGSRIRHAKPRDVRSIGEIGRLDVADVAVAVSLEVGVKRERVDLLHTGNLLGQVHDQVGRLHVGHGSGTRRFAPLFDDKQVGRFPAPPRDRDIR